jgi:hypothetical protein
VPEHKDKYVGKHVPTCRSSWESRFCHWVDHLDVAIEWASEPFGLQYSYRSENGAPVWGLYVPDYYVKMMTNSGVKKFLIEVKPYKQTVPPVAPKTNRKTSLDRYRGEQVLFAKNMSKWEYAKKFCKRHGMEFKIVTEKDVF